jgi:transposase
LRRWLDAALAGPVALQSQVFSAGGSTTVMGIKEREFRPLSDNLSLEELVSKANFYRRQEGRIDLSFVRKLVLDRYASVGRTSIDPVVFFRLQLVMFFEGIRSERQLMEIASDRLSVRWHLGYDLHEPLSDHSSLTRIRERYGLEILKGFFEKIVEMCVEVGLVGREEVFFDSTKVKANAEIDSLASRFLVETHLSGLFERSWISEEGSEVEPPSTELDTLPTSEDEALIAANAGNCKTCQLRSRDPLWPLSPSVAPS